MTATPQTQATKKPWYKIWWIWVIIVAVLMVFGAINQAAGNTEEDAPTAPTESTAVEVTVPDVVGADGAEARDTLTGLGLEVEFDAGAETVIKASNWTVEKQYPAAGERAKTGTSVTLTVSKPQPEPETAEEQAALSEINAAQHLAHAWEDRMTYGGTVHWIVDRITSVNGDGTYTFKIGATIENAYGNKFGATIEGDVGGTNEAPVIIDSIMYADTGEVINYHG